MIKLPMEIAPDDATLLPAAAMAARVLHETRAANTAGTKTSSQSKGV